MAKATATCTCATCGRTFTVTALKANRRDANSWESWAADHYDECNDCRDKRVAAERAEEDLGRVLTSSSDVIEDLADA